MEPSELIWASCRSRELRGGGHQRRGFGEDQCWPLAAEEGAGKGTASLCPLASMFFGGSILNTAFIGKHPETKQLPVAGETEASWTFG